MIKTVTPYIPALLLVGLSIALSIALWFVLGGFNSAGLLYEESQTAIESEANLVLVQSLIAGAFYWVIAFLVLRKKSSTSTNRFLPLIVSTICGLLIIFAGFETREYVLKSKYFPIGVSSELSLPNKRMQSDRLTATPLVGG